MLREDLEIVTYIPKNNSYNFDQLMLRPLESTSNATARIFELDKQVTINHLARYKLVALFWKQAYDLKHSTERSYINEEDLCRLIIAHKYLSGCK